MARPKCEKKSEPTTSAERRVLPMELLVGDRITDETGEWEMIGRTYTMNAGEGRPRSRRDRSINPMFTEIRIWARTGNQRSFD
jgi:hypothetical protein